MQPVSFYMIVQLIVKVTYLGGRCEGNLSLFVGGKPFFYIAFHHVQVFWLCRTLSQNAFKYITHLESLRHSLVNKSTISAEFIILSTNLVRVKYLDRLLNTQKYIFKGQMMMTYCNFDMPKFSKNNLLSQNKT